MRGGKLYKHTLRGGKVMMTVEEKVRDHDGNWAGHNEDELGTKMRGRLVRRVVLGTLVVEIKAPVVEVEVDVVFVDPPPTPEMQTTPETPVSSSGAATDEEASLVS